LETELDKSTEEINSLKNENSDLADKCGKLEMELKGRTEDLHFERTSINSLQTEVAQFRNKLEIQEATVQEQSDIITVLKTEIVSESKARIVAEKESAVFAAKLEAEQEKSGALQSDRTVLTTQLAAERHATESALGQAKMVTAELAERSKELTLNAAKLEKLSASYESEILHRSEAEKSVKSLIDQLATQVQAADFALSESARLVEASVQKAADLEAQYNAEKLAHGNTRQEVMALRAVLKKQEDVSPSQPPE
jgi:chromosome segregation ATPase